jgi:hypothetical protein
MTRPRASLEIADIIGVVRFDEPIEIDSDSDGKVTPGALYPRACAQ